MKIEIDVQLMYSARYHRRNLPPSKHDSVTEQRGTPLEPTKKGLIDITVSAGSGQIETLKQLVQ